MSTVVAVPPRPVRSAPRAVVRQPSKAARVIWALSGLNLAVVALLLLLVFVVSERWWIGTVVTYLPRSPWVIPSLVLGITALLWHRPSLWINIVALGLVLGPLMELHGPGLNAAQTIPSDPQQRLRVVSCNVQAFKPDFPSVIQEVAAFQPDVVALQEARGDDPLLLKVFPDWHRLHVDYYWIGSKYPLRLLQECTVETFERTSGLIVEIQTPQGPVVLADLHLMTARRGLMNLSKRDVITGEAAGAIENFQQLREAEAAELRQYVDQHVNDRPLVAVGDFNTPSSSHLFQRYWGDLRNAFDTVGNGYGYTSPSKPHKHWLSNTPWARIDHILCSPDWAVTRVQIGQTSGSDHRLIAAELVR